MKIACGFDHAGFPLKEEVLEIVRDAGHDPLDLGTDSPDPVDYPEIALRVAGALRAGDAERGVLVCGSSAGVAVAAGKVDGIRAATIHDPYTAHQAVEHDDANVACLGGRVLGTELAGDLLRTYLAATFSGGERHRRRLVEIEMIERDGLDAALDEATPDGPPPSADAAAGAGSPAADETPAPAEPAPSARLRALAALGTSIWLDMIRRSMLEDGRFAALISGDAVSGLTANPSIFEKAILGSSDYDARLGELAARGHSARSIYDVLSVEDVRAAADLLRPVWERSDGADGFASLEVDPEIARDVAATTASASDLWQKLDRPNVMIKIPGTDEGAEAIRASIAAGININVTLLFSLEAYKRCAEGFVAGLEDRLERGEPVSDIASVASFFVSRVDTAADRRLGERGREELAGTAGVANARLAYAHYRELVESERWARLEAEGARRQRPLWASTGTKDPRYSDVKYVEELAGPEVVNTMPLETMLAFADHGEPADALTGSGEDAAAALQAVEEAGVSMEEVTGQLLEEGIEKFVTAMDELLAGIEQRRGELLAGAPTGIRARLADDDAAAIEERVEWAEEADVPWRVWRKDHTLWGPSPEEITNRLGWLHAPAESLERVDSVAHLADRARDEGLTDCVLLAMGGSSLAPEVLRRSFPDAGGLRLHVLDSTHPDTVAALAEAVPLDSTLFAVASKSGTTLEPNCFYRYFRARLPDASRFVAITDPGTELDRLGREQGFRHVFFANPEVGGRYSALTAFGMVPGKLAGIDTRAILQRAEIPRHAVMPTLRCGEADPLWLGLALGELARRGRDKLTFVVDAPLDAFGLWAEQLVAESTGKQGTGIVPVCDEPLGSPEAYGEDRVFAHIHAAGGDGGEADAPLAALADAGHPVIEIPFRDRDDIGSLFFIWEYAIAVAGAVLGINSFDQPNVQEAKDLTREAIEAYLRDGGFPAETPDATEDELAVFEPGAPGVDAALAALLRIAAPGRFLALLAYLPYSEEIDGSLTDIRLAVRDARHCATTAGYGPRYLHSTGQLHKGGPATGVFLQLTSDGRAGAEIPDSGYDFAALVHAQAAGDLRALRGKGLPALRVHISGDPAAGVAALAARVREVLKA